jgi:cell division protein FtsB
MALENLIPGVSQAKLIIGGVVLAALIGVGVTIKWQHSTIQELRADKTLLEANSKTLVDNTNTLRDNYLACSTANKTTLETIAALKKERQDAIDALERLAATRRNDQFRIDSLNKLLDNLRRNPANNGPVAPVLRETIREIQNGDQP